MKHALEDPDLKEPNQVQQQKPVQAADERVRHWFPISRMDAQSRGLGYPSSYWKFDHEGVRRITSHDHEYLQYGIPLTGNFVVEADTTTFDYHDIHLGYGCTWAGPAHERNQCLIGSFQRDLPSAAIQPPLSPVAEWMRVRLEVRDGVQTTWVNGRQVYERRHTENSDPWLSIHSTWYCNGAIKNLLIAGQPTIPETIQLVTTEDLSGWLPYFEGLTSEWWSDWRLRRQPKSDPQENNSPMMLVGRRRPEVNGTVHENLLRYHRPMLEDGTIEYEFFYSPGQFEVHPAMGGWYFC